jgi:hypothetical protein
MSFFAEKVPKIKKVGKTTINFVKTSPQSNGLIEKNKQKTSWGGAVPSSCSG